MRKLKTEVGQGADIFDDTSTHRALQTLPTGLSRATLSRITGGSLEIEMPEQKHQSQMIVLDEDLSEFERARRTSKTWSMGQD